MRAYWTLIRPVNLLITLLTQLVFLYASSRITPFSIDWTNLRWFHSPFYFPVALWVLLACIFSASAGYVINDLFDVDSDHVNRPNKRILKRYISHKAAIIYYGILATLGVLMGFFGGIGMGIFCIAIAILLFFYSSDLKAMGLPGNLLVAFMAGAVVYLSSRGVWQVNKGHIAEFAMLAFTITLARELIKDIEDMKGDKEANCRTFPLVYGITKTKILVYLSLGISAVGILFNTIFQAAYTYPIKNLQEELQKITVGTSILPMLLYTGIVLTPRMCSICISVHKASSTADFRQVSLKLKWLMILGIIGVLFTPI